MADSDLAAGVGCSVAHLRDPSQYIDWKDFCVFLQNLSRFFTRDELVDMGGEFLRSPFLRPFTLVARLLFSVADSYRWTYAPTSPLTGVFTCVRPRLIERGPGRIQIQLEIAEGHEPNEAFFLISQGGMAEVPCLLGLPRAEVKLNLDGNRATYDVVYPLKGGALSWIWRGLAWPFRLVAAGRELKRANEDLQKRYFELQDHRDHLEKKVAERTLQLEESLQKLKEADRLKTEFFGNASHELRTPLTLMLAPLEVLANKPGLGAEAKAEIQGVTRSGYKLLKLVNDLLDLSKIEAGKMTLTMSSADLVPLLGEVLRPWGPVLKTRSISLTTDLGTALPLAADPERLEQVALNLISNAIKFTPDGGTIAVKAGATDGKVWFSVENSGEGLDPAELPNLFGRFTQSTRSKSRKFGSTGLGLPVVRELVELHGGTIDAESKLGAWVRFTVKLPVGRVEAAGPQAAQVTPTAGELTLFDATAHRENSAAASPLALATDERADLPSLMVAEDNEALRSFVVKNLASTFRIIEAGDGAQALRLVRQHQPDLVLSDLMMPELDGLELCAAMKADPQLANIPFLLLTARSEIDTRLSGFEKGADDYLMKPFHLEELRARLSSQLRLRKLATQMAQREKLAALGSVVAGVAHEIRNPLNGIINALEPLKELLPSASPELVELIDLAIESSKRVEYVSDQLLKQGRAGEGTHGDVDLSQNVQLALQLLSHKVGGVAITSDLEPNESVNVVGEAGALHQVWVNLIDNAIQAASPSGQVRVRVSRANGHAQVEVSDTGRGIEPRILKRIWDPFFTTKDVGSGTGLGLAIVREIVEKHGGQISVDSTVGQGSRFTVRLPHADATDGGAHVRH